MTTVSQDEVLVLSMRAQPAVSVLFQFLVSLICLACVVPCLMTGNLLTESAVVSQGDVTSVHCLDFTMTDSPNSSNNNNVHNNVNSNERSPRVLEYISSVPQFVWQVCQDAEIFEGDDVQPAWVTAETENNVFDGFIRGVMQDCICDTHYMDQCVTECAPCGALQILGIVPHHWTGNNYFEQMRNVVIETRLRYEAGVSSDTDAEESDSDSDSGSSCCAQSGTDDLPVIPENESIVLAAIEHIVERNSTIYPVPVKVIAKIAHEMGGKCFCHRNLHASGTCRACRVAKTVETQLTYGTVYSPKHELIAPQGSVDDLFLHKQEAEEIETPVELPASPDSISTASYTSEYGVFQEFMHEFLDTATELHMHKDSEHYCKVVEHIALFALVDLPKASCKKDVVIAAYRLFSACTGYSLANMVHGWIGLIIEGLDFQMRAQGAADIFDHAVSGMEYVTMTDAYQQVRKLVCAITSVSMSKYLGVDIGEKVFGGLWEKFHPLLGIKDVLTTVFEFAKWLVTRGIEILRGDKSISDVLFSVDRTREFDKRVARLDYINTRLLQGSEDDEGITLDTYIEEVLDLQATGEKMLDSSSNKMVRVAIHNQLKVIMKHRAEFKRLSDVESLREQPFALLMYGISSVGKTCLTSLMVPQLQHAMGIPSGPEYVYNFDSSDKYMSALDPRKNTFVTDDLGHMNPLYVDVQASELVISLINNHKRFAVMADVDSKGKVPIRPNIIVASTNRPDLHATTTSVAPLAIWRRFCYHIEVTVRDECSINKGMMKPDHKPEECRYDCWLLNLYQWVSTQESPHYARVVVMERKSFPEVMKFLVGKARIFHDNQRALVARMKVAHKQPYCKHDIFREICKECDADELPLPTREQLVEAALSELPLHLQLGVQGGWLQDRMWEMGENLEKAAAGMKKQAVSDEAKAAVEKSVGWHTASKLWIASVEIKKRLVTPWQWIALVLTGVGMSVITTSATMVFPLVCMYWSLSMLSVFTLTTGMRVLGYLRMGMISTVTAAVQAVRKDWQKKLQATLPIIGLVLASYVAYKCWHSQKRKELIEVQGSRVSLPIPATVTSNGDPYRVPQVEKVPKNLDMRTATADQMAGVLKSRLCVMRFMRDGECKEYCQSWPVKTNFWLAPYHLLKKDFDQVQMVKYDSNHNNSIRKANIKGNWQRIGTTDYGLVYLPVMSDQKDLTSLFPSYGPEKKLYKVEGVGAQVVWIHPTKKEHPEKPDVHFIHIESGVAKVHAKSDLVRPQGVDAPYWGGEYVFPVPTWPGLCGAPLLTDVSGPTLLGLHSAGVTGTGVARYCTIMREDLLDTIKEMVADDSAKVEGAEESDFTEELDFPGTPFTFQAGQRPYATSLYVQGGSFDVLGSTNAPTRTFRSNVKDTVISNDICLEFGVQKSHGAPKYIGSWVPFNVWLSQIAEPSIVPGDVVDMAYKDYCSQIHKAWSDNPEWNWEARIHPLAEDAILSGWDGLKGCYPINFKASMGIPWCKPKSDYIKVSDRKVPGISCVRDMPPEIHKAIAKMEEKLAAGKRVYVPMRCNLKDEAVKLNKAKVRVFMGPSFPYLFLMRKYFLMVSVVMQDHPEVFECAVGTNAFSVEWTRLHDSIFKYGKERCIAGDYAAYDQKMYVQLTLASFKVIISMCKRAGYDDRQLAICRGLMTETCMAIYELKNEWLRIAAGNPSGHALTVIVNSMYNSMKMRCAYFELCPDVKPLPFRERVSLMTYGDDNIMSVHSEAPWYNHTAIAAVFANYGMVYTMADKDAESVPYVHASQTSFLKRSWVWSEEYGRYLCPLEVASVFKSLTCAHVGDSLTPVQLAAELVSNANREFWQYGRERFAEAHEKFLRIAEKHELLHHMPGGRLHSYQELEDWFLSN